MMITITKLRHDYYFVIDHVALSYVYKIGLTWSQTDDSFTLHALPPMHCTNMIETASSAMYYSDMNAFDVGADAGGDGGGGGGGGGGGFDDVCGEDFDYNVDCADFLI